MPASKITELNGEVEAIATRQGERRLIVVLTDEDARVLVSDGDEAFAEDTGASAFLRSLLSGLSEDTPALRAEFVGDILCLSVNSSQLTSGGTSVVLAVDLATQEVRELVRVDSLFTIPAIVGVDDRFLLVGVYEDASQSDGRVARVMAFDLANRTEYEILRLDYEKDGVAVPDAGDATGEDDGEWEGVRPLITHLTYASAARRLYLVTLDPDQGEGNRICAVTLDENCRLIGDPELLLHEICEPYSPIVGGACASPYRDEVVAVMYASEWEKFVPISSMPGESDFLSAADLHVVRSGEPPRRLAVLGQLGINIAFYDREAEAPNLPNRFRIRFDFDGAGNEVTPVIPLDQNRYLIALFGGTLTEINADTGAQSVVHRFGKPITALQSGFDSRSVFVGLATGEFFTITVPQGV
ncbi:MAG: hypothetical protein H7145_22760 [Akkermansiaceae bacterium]|nr:hypothetical protein [Armatimonadota bacterium]